VDYSFEEDPVSLPRQVQHSPYSTHTSFLVHSIADTPAGGEVFTNYGKQWFKDRNIKRNKATSTHAASTYSLDELTLKGVCMSDIYVAESSIPFAGKGVFANKQFRRGDVVSVSPVLVLPRHVMEAAGDHSVLLNYCITAPTILTPTATITTTTTTTTTTDGDTSSHASSSDVALLPLSQAGMMNHGVKGEEVGTANVALDW
jgi:hypothetical protein